MSYRFKWINTVNVCMLKYFRIFKHNIVCFFNSFSEQSRKAVVIFPMLIIVPKRENYFFHHLLCPCLIFGCEK